MVEEIYEMCIICGEVVTRERYDPKVAWLNASHIRQPRPMLLPKMCDSLEVRIKSKMCHVEYGYEIYLQSLSHPVVVDVCYYWHRIGWLPTSLVVTHVEDKSLLWVGLQRNSDEGV